MSSSTIDSRSLSPQQNSQVLPDSFSLTAQTAYTKENHVYSSIERQPKKEVKQQIQQNNTHVDKDDERGQNNNAQPIYATINHEGKRNKRNRMWYESWK